MSRSLLLLAGLALAAVAALLVLSPGTEEDAPVLTGGAPAVTQDAAPQAGSLEADAGGEPAAAPGVVERTESAPAPAAAPQRAEVLPSLADGEGIRVEVVAAEDGRALAGAEVMVVDTGRVDELALQEAMAQTRDVTAVLDALAEHYRTRADGSVVIPHVDEMLAVAGRSGSLFEFRLPAVPDADDRLVLRLKPMRTLPARVVDEQGAPVEGVRVALLAGGSEEILSATTGADGIAEIENVGLLDSMPIRGDARVGLSMLLDPPVEEPVDVTEPDPEPVELRLPPTGSLRVLLVDRDGAPVGAGVGVVAISVDDETHEFERYYGGRARAHTVTGSDGVAHFPHVGLGLHVAVEGRALSDSGLWRGVAAGPVSRGQQVEMRLEPDLTLPTVLVRLVDAEGEPLAGVRLQAELDQESEYSSWSSSGPVRTDAEGAVRYPFEEPPQEGAQRTLTFTREADGEQLKLVGRLDLSARLDAGVNDFGTLALVPPPLLVSGTVLGPDRKPVAGAQISVQKRNWWGPREAGNFHWENLWRLDTRSGSDGRFTVQALVDAEELRVVASKPGLRDAESEFRAGAADLVLQMRTGAALHGQVLVDEGVPMDALQVTLQAKEAEEQGSSWQAGLDGEGRFAWDSLPDGAFDFAVIAAEGGHALYEVKDLRLLAGADNRDARVSEIDLRGRIHAFRLEFVDEDGERVEQVEVTAPDVEPPLRWYAWDGDLQVVTAMAPLRLVAFAPGRRQVELQGVDKDRKVEMSAGLPVTLVLDQPSAVPPGWELGAWLHPVMEGEAQHTYYGNEECLFDSRGIAETRMRGPGSFQVQFFLGRDGGHSRWGTGDALVVEVADLPGGQRIAVRVDAEALARTRERMEENEDGR